MLMRVALITLTLFVIIGCGQTTTAPKHPSSGSPLRSGKHYVSPMQATNEYFEETSRLTLAPGWKWPARPIGGVMPNGDRVMYEQGYGRQAADRFWFCSWAATATAARPDSARRHRALLRAFGIRKLYYYTTSLQGISKAYFKRELTAARRGRLSVLKKDVALNCRRAG
jgi:hypothetical protein